MAESTAPRKICVIGGGATGVSLLWCLTSQEATRKQVALTLLHDDDTLGGHSRTVHPEFNGTKYPVDIGVQFICPLLYPNTYKMLERPEFKGLKLDDGDVRLAATFTEQLNWGNFAAYQSGPLFAKLYTPENVAAAKQFQRAVELAPIEGRLSQTVGEYLQKHPLTPAFVAYFLMPYLSVFNGYGDDEQLMLATFEDLWPIFTPLASPGPLASFSKPGLGWQRFHDGSGAWIDAMAAYATSRGATIKTNARANMVWPDTVTHKVWVQWGGEQPDWFDAVVLTTDMTTNRALLNNPNNPYYDSPNQPITQAPYIAEDKFPLNPGSCYIHQDDTVLAPYLTTRDEMVQFTAYYSPTPTNRLPYDMATTYSTYLVQNMLPGLPEPVYVSMYGSYEAPKAPGRQLFKPIQWRHGRFLGSFMVQSKRALHKIQGLAHMWFAGNNTTLDSEEGALVSAMVIAEKICPDWEYPYYGIDEATLMYELIKDEMMFPITMPGLWRNFRHWLGRTL